MSINGNGEFGEMEGYFDIAISINGTQVHIQQLASISNPKNNSIIFVTERYLNMWEHLVNVQNCLIFWPKEVIIPSQIEKRNKVIECERPRLEMARFLKKNEIVSIPQKVTGKWENGYFRADSSEIGRGCTIMEGAYIGSDVVIGQNVYIGCGTKILGRVKIGDNTVIRENAVIGCEGLSYERDEEGNIITIPQFGGIVIGDNVVIGALSVVARGAIDDTVIESGVKIDNSCFVSHNVIIGRNSTIVGESLLMGSVEIGEKTNISGNVTIRDKINIADNSFVGMGAVVTKNVEKNKIVVGNPAKELK